VFILALILVAIAVGAYPVVRRLTRRLERLQHGVTRWEGDLSTRVKVEGRDEVARLAELQPGPRAHRTPGRREQALLAAASHELRTPLARIHWRSIRRSAPTRRASRLEHDIAGSRPLPRSAREPARRRGAARGRETVDRSRSRRKRAPAMTSKSLGKARPCAARGSCAG
jgi:signal transduction histidine kinase